MPTVRLEQGQPLIRFTKTCKSFRGGDPVLADIDLDIHAGELVAIIGPSGCGKSTLLNLLAGITGVTSGSVQIAQPDLTSSYVFQRPRLLPWRSVLRNVEFGLEGGSLSQSQRRERARAALELVHLGSHVEKYPHELSGGMQQRAALARGLALEPGLLLLDEPFGALDALTRGYLQEELLRIVRQAGTTTLLVTHDIDEALLLADRVVVMSHRPAHIMQIFDVPFARRVGFDDAMAHRDFVPLRHQIRALLRPENGDSDSQTRAS